jgi:hypothetical protein
VKQIFASKTKACLERIFACMAMKKFGESSVKLTFGYINFRSNKLFSKKYFEQNKFRSTNLLVKLRLNNPLPIFFWSINLLLIIFGQTAFGHMAFGQLTFRSKSKSVNDFSVKLNRTGTAFQNKSLIQGYKDSKLGNQSHNSHSNSHFLALLVRFFHCAGIFSPFSVDKKLILANSNNHKTIGSIMVVPKHYYLQGNEHKKGH